MLLQHCLDDRPSTLADMMCVSEGDEMRVYSIRGGMILSVPRQLQRIYSCFRFVTVIR